MFALGQNKWGPLMVAPQKAFGFSRELFTSGYISISEKFQYILALAFHGLAPLVD